MNKIKKALIQLTILSCTNFLGISYALNASEVYEKVNGSTFMIYSYDIKEKKLNNVSQGSAVAVTSNILITNCHVLSEHENLAIKMANKYKHATLIGGDKEIDLCLIFVPAVSLNPVVINAADKLKIGEQIFTVGSPEGQENTLSQGIISGIKNIDGHLLINIDANIDHGSSGGGLFDDQGNLIGITSLKINNLAYAIPTNWILEIIPSLNQTTEKTQSVEIQQKAQEEPLIPLKISDFGLDDVGLFKYGKTCFIHFNGRDIYQHVVSQALWFPVSPNLVFLAKGSQPLTKLLNQIIQLDQTNFWIKQTTSSYFIFNQTKIPLFLAKTQTQPEFLLMSDLQNNPAFIFKEGNYFTAYLVSASKPTKIVNYGLMGFTDAYVGYLNLCK